MSIFVDFLTNVVENFAVGTFLATNENDGVELLGKFYQVTFAICHTTTNGVVTDEIGVADSLCP